MSGHPALTAWAGDVVTAGSIATQQAVPLDLFVEEATWTGLFDRLEVWRSRETAAGPFEPLTDDAWMPARLPASALGDVSSATGPSVNLTGLELDLKVNELVDLAVTFSGSDPLTSAAAAAQITAASLGLVRAFVTSAGVLVLETAGAGLPAILRVVGGDAAPLLGLATEEPLSVNFGRDARITLLPGQERYPFLDPNGSAAYFYKTRLFNASTHETSDFSPAFQAPAIARLTASALVRGTLDLVDAEGNPVANRSVLVYLRFHGAQIQNRAVVGSPTRKWTDVNGHVEFMLTRGLAITVSIAGTDLSRDISVPTDPAIDSFDLLDASVGTDDLFVVQRPNIPFAARRSL